MPTRRINVFARVDGTVLHDVLHNTPSASTERSGAKPRQVSAHTIWPIVHNFIALSRELDRTASLRRLVFRDPQQYAPPVSNFRPAVRPNRKHSPPIVIHCLLRAPFVVTVTETLPNYTLFDQHDQHAASSSSSTEFTLSDFCDTIMHFVHKEYNAFSAANRAEGQDDAHVNADTQSNGNGSINEGDNNNNNSHGDETVQTLKQVIEQSKLTEMIHNTMLLVEL